MKGFYKSKGIVIELTALLDVILIMLFWVMMNTRNDMTSAVADAENKVIAAEQRLDEVQKELDSIREEKDAEISHIWEIAESINKDAAANQQALIGFENGRLVTLNIRYDSDERLYIYNNSQQLIKTDISSEEDVFSAIVSSFEQAKLEKEDVVLCTLVYDSKTSLYKDVNNVKKAIEKVRTVYTNFYCAYINTSN